MKIGVDWKMEKSARPRTALNECVKVVVRCRPLSAREISEGNEEVRCILSPCAVLGLRGRGASRCDRGRTPGHHCQQRISCVEQPDARQS